MKLSEKSYNHSLGENHFCYFTLPQLLEKRVKETPNKEAHVFRQGTKASEDIERVAITYQELSDKSYFLATSLLKIGLEKEDRILVIGRDCPEWLYLEYACLRVQILQVRLSPEVAKTKLVMETIVKYNCRAVVVDLHDCDEETDKIIDMLNASDDDGKPSRLIAMRPSQKQDEHSDVATIQDLIKRKKKNKLVKQIQYAIRCDETAVILSTSGSSGIVRFTELSHFAVVNNTYFSEGKVLKSPDDKYFNDRPFSWLGCHLYVSIVLGVGMVHLEPAIGSGVQTTGVVQQVFIEENVTCAKVMTSFIHELSQALLKYLTWLIIQLDVEILE